MRRIISVFISAIIVLCSASSFVFAENNERFTATDNNFVSTSDYSTREQAVACFIRTVGIDRFKSSDTILNKFSDKSKVSYAYLDEMSAAVYSGLISGYEDKTLRPQSPITRAEALVILNRALSHTELVNRYSVEFSDTPDWARNQIDRLASAGIVKGYGDGTLGAYDYLTPQQVNTLCDRISRFTGPMGDFYTFVNSSWLESTSLPNGVSVQSETDRMSQLVNERITDIIFSLYRRYYNDGESFDDGSNEKKIIDVYSAAANIGYRDKIGLSPIKPFIDDIDKASNIPEIVSVMANMEKNGYTSLLPIKLDINIYDSAKYILSLSGCYIGIDDSLITGENSEKYLGLYRKYLAELFEQSGENPVDADNLASQAVHICRTLALSHNKTKASRNASEPAQIYKIKKADSLLSNINLPKYLSAYGYTDADSLMIYDTELATTANNLLTPENLPAIKAYLKASVLDSSAIYLTSDMFAAYEDFQNSIIGGSSALIPSDYAVSIVQELLGWELGRIYIDLYFSDSAKTATEEMTAKIISEYERLINTCTRMTPQTRAAAIKKLKNLTINAAYPDDIDSYTQSSIEIKPTSEGGNLVEYKTAYSRAHNNYCISAIKKTTAERLKRWLIYPQTVNAMYDPISNSITIPAGMLQPPFFDINATFEENLGGIGAVIAHEISHAFDSSGARFDENGSLSNWWTQEDYSSFKVLCERIAKEYNGLPSGDGLVDGELTLNENLADIAGMSCILSLAGADNPNLDLLFENYAKTWRTKASKEYENLMLKTDEHSPAKIRVNRVLSNFDEFENFYDVIDGDGMYIPKENRINIWE